MKVVIFGWTLAHARYINYNVNYRPLANNGYMSNTNQVLDINNNQYGYSGPAQSLHVNNLFGSWGQQPKPYTPNLPTRIIRPPSVWQPKPQPMYPAPSPQKPYLPISYQQKPIQKPVPQKPIYYQQKPVPQKPIYYQQKPINMYPTPQKPMQMMPLIQKPIIQKPILIQPYQKPTPQKPIQWFPYVQKPVPQKPIQSWDLPITTQTNNIPMPMPEANTNQMPMSMPEANTIQDSMGIVEAPVEEQTPEVESTEAPFQPKPEENPAEAAGEGGSLDNLLATFQEALEVDTNASTQAPETAAEKVTTEKQTTTTTEEPTPAPETAADVVTTEQQTTTTREPTRAPETTAEVTTTTTTTTAPEIEIVATTDSLAGLLEFADLDASDSATDSDDAINFDELLQDTANLANEIAEASEDTASIIPTESNDPSADLVDSFLASLEK